MAGNNRVRPLPFIAGSECEFAPTRFRRMNLRKAFVMVAALPCAASAAIVGTPFGQFLVFNGIRSHSRGVVLYRRF
jgi:hypothetical protein